MLPLCLVSLALAPLAKAETLKASAEPLAVTLKDGTEMTLTANYDINLSVKEPLTPPPRKMALIVRNNIKGMSDHAPTSQAFASLVAAAVSGPIEILDLRDTLLTMQPSTEDAPLLSKTTATQLARQLGADALLTLTLETFTQTQQNLRDKRLGPAFAPDGTTYQQTTKRLSASYRVVDATTGSSIGGGTVKASRKTRATADLETTHSSPFEGMEEDLAEALAEKILEEASTWREILADSTGLPVTFTVMAYDMNNQPIYLPHYDGQTPILYQTHPARLNATIEIDGVVMGAVDTLIPLTKGLHTVTISHPGYEPITLRIAPRDGMVVSVNLRMTAAEYARNKDAITFMHTLTKDREQSQANVSVLEGYAQQLQQSGIRFDIKELPEQTIEYRELL
jgi:hypothetical protein